MPVVVWVERIPFEVAGPLAESYTVDIDGQQFMAVRPGAFALKLYDGTIHIAYPNKVKLTFLCRED